MILVDDCTRQPPTDTEEHGALASGLLEADFAARSAEVERQLAAMGGGRNGGSGGPDPGRTPGVNLLVIVPVQPAILDLDRIEATLEPGADAQALNGDLVVRMLLTRVRKGTRSQRDIREILAEDGLNVLETEIPHREAIGLAGGSVVVRLDAYEPRLEEIRTERVA